MNYQNIIDKYYPEGSELRDTYMSHASKVTKLALALNRAGAFGLDEATVEAAAMLHDIGIFQTNAPGIHCHGTEPYLRHGVIGAKLLREIGAPEQWARVAERHTGAGITAEDIKAQQLPIPPGNYCPETLLEQLICYADKFYSKSGTGDKKTLEAVRRSMAKFGEGSVARFEKMHMQFRADKLAD
jgi:uncharacterized protein